MWRLLIGSLALAFAVIPANAHDPEGVWDDWFELQRNKHGASCCELSHAHFVNDGDWKISGQRYQVRVGELWYSIEDWQLLKPARPNPTGKAILWYHDPSAEWGLYILCFTPSHQS